MRRASNVLTSNEMAKRSKNHLSAAIRSGERSYGIKPFEVRVDRIFTIYLKEKTEDGEIIRLKVVVEKFGRWINLILDPGAPHEDRRTFYQPDRDGLNEMIGAACKYISESLMQRSAQTV